MVYLSDLLRESKSTYKYFGNENEIEVNHFTTDFKFGSKDCLVCLMADYEYWYQKNRHQSIGLQQLVLITNSLDNLLNQQLIESVNNVFYIVFSKTPLDLVKIFQQIKYPLLEKQKSTIQNLSHHLMQQIASTSEIQTIVDDFASFLQNPMIVTDETYKVLVHTQLGYVSDPIWHDIVKNAYSSFSLVEKTNKNSFWQRLARAELPLFVDANVFKGSARRAVARIKVKEKIKGYIALLEINQKIVHLDLVLLQILADVLSIKISEYDTILQATGRLENEFASSLLTNKSLDYKLITNQIRLMKLKFGHFHCVLCLQPNMKTMGFKKRSLSLKRALINSVDLVIHAQRQQQFYLILSFSDKEQLINLRRRELPSLLKKYDLIGILSLVVTDLLTLSSCYTQVEKIRLLLPKIKQNGQMLYSYANYAVLALITSLMSTGSTALPSRAYLTLKQYDDEHSSAFIETLATFFACNQSVSRTASQLFLHRNTINYRLNRIRDILIDDFDDPLIRLHLYLSIISAQLN